MYFQDFSWRRVPSSLPSFILLLISHHFQIINAAESFKVFAPDQPVVAVLGEDAELPCRLSPALTTEHMEVKWIQTKTTFIVHLYQNGVDKHGQQFPEYRGRTTLIRNCLSCGSVSLRIHNIGLKDEGQYRCLFHFDTYEGEATVELKVASLGNALFISVNDHQGREIRVLCESAGWYPEPEVTWRQEDGQSLTPISETKTQAQNGLFSISTSLLMRTNQYGKISCHIRNIILNQERGAVISVADSFLQRVPRWMVSLAILLMSVIILWGLLVVLVIYHLRKERQEKENLSDEILKLSSYAAKIPDNFESTCSDLEWIGRRSYAVNVTLDPETAHPYLIISEDRKTVRDGGTKQNLPYSPQRFDTCHFVIGLKNFSRGRHYWEVEVGDKTGWVLGICKDSVRRKEQITLTPEDGYWTVLLREEGTYYASTSSWTLLPLSVRPQAVAIFLDYEVGKVSFYNADNKSHLFTFTETFTEQLWPILSPDFNRRGKNAGALRIRPVSDQD